MRSEDEIKTIFAIARAENSLKVEIDGVTYHLNKEEKKEEVIEPTEEQIRLAFDPQEFSDDEILYYATPYYDELQNLKKEKQLEVENG